MNEKEQIKEYIAGQPELKRSDIEKLHRLILKALPKCKLWFFDGKNEKNEMVAYPTIGYGAYTIKYTDGRTREFFQIGLGANKPGLFVHVLGLKDKTYLTKTYGKKLGKAKLGSYAINFKSLEDIDTDVLQEAIRDGAALSKKES